MRGGVDPIPTYGKTGDHLIHSNPKKSELLDTWEFLNSIVHRNSKGDLT